MAAPLIGAASGPIRNAITLAMAAGWTARWASDGDIQVRLAGVSMTDGRMQLTRMPCGRSSSASSELARTTADLLVAWASGAGPPTPVLEPTVTIAPPPAAAIRGAACWQHHSRDTTLDRHRVSSAFSSSSASEPGTNPPASVISAAGAPTSSASICSQSELTDSRSASSAGTGYTPGWAPSASSRGPARSSASTVQACPRSSVSTAPPSAPAAPVTTTTSLIPLPPPSARNRLVVEPWRTPFPERPYPLAAFGTGRARGDRDGFGVQAAVQVTRLAVAEQSLDPAQRRGRPGRQPGRQLPGLIGQPAVRHDHRDQPGGQRLRRVQHLVGEQNMPGPGGAHQPRQGPGHAAVRGEPDARVARAEPGRAARDGDV